MVVGEGERLGLLARGDLEPAQLAGGEVEELAGAPTAPAAVAAVQLAGDLVRVRVPPGAQTLALS